MFIGIDLGTTNSTLATFDGEVVKVIPNAAGENLTPSVVRIDGSGGETVGRAALRFLETDPAGTRAEWKRLMGTAERLKFDPIGRALLPEELSARVLASLLADARDAVGVAPRAAVISTPALFELPQNHATVRAGKLAGLEEVVLIQEPIASAIAAGWRGEGEGTWMVFDLGGGTLDVSLLETKDGRLRVVDHAGDNFLGGKDMDQVLVTWAAREIARHYGVPDLAAPAGGGRADPQGPSIRPIRPAAVGAAAPVGVRERRALARLRAACEQAKIALSRSERAAVQVPDFAVAADGGTIDVDLPISRADLDGLTQPLIERGFEVVRSLLAKNQRRADDVARVVLVGGPTLMPGLRARVAALFGGRIADGVDPMTIVARGAALYAGTTGLDARPVKAAPTAKAGLAVRIEHPAVTADLEPFVVGRFLAQAGEALPARVRVERGDGGFRSADVALGTEGSFVVQVRIERNHQNHFTVSAFDVAGARVRLATETFAIVHGISIADPPLSRSVGVAGADDLVHVYFSKGTPLPARRTVVHRTAKPVSAKRQEDVLAIPVVQGESRRAHRGRLIGMLHVRGVKGDLPAGSRIEVTLHLDRSGQLHARADVPALGQTFEEVVHLLVPTASVETIERELGGVGARVDDVQRRAFEAGAPEAIAMLGGAAGLLREAERCLPAARGGDADAAQKLHRILLDVGSALDDAEAVLEWPDVEKEARQSALYYTPLVAAWGTPAEQVLFDQALQAAAAAEKARNLFDLERHMDAMRAIGRASYCRNPRTLESELEWAESHVTEAVDVTRAHQLIVRASTARTEGNRAALRALVSELWSLFPAPPELARLSYDSGVR